MVISINFKKIMRLEKEASPTRKKSGSVKTSSGHAPGPGGSSPRDIGEDSDGPGADIKKTGGVKNGAVL